MKQNENLKQKLARALRAKAQPVKYQNNYAGADEAIRAHYYEALVQIYGPEAIYGDDGRSERHPYFGDGGDSGDSSFRYWS